MSDQVLIQFRADRKLKQDVTEIYESLGMDLPTALRMFMSMSRLRRGIPFEVTVPENAEITPQEDGRTEFREAFERLRADAADLPEMTLDEINAEIAAARAERKNRKEQQGDVELLFHIGMHVFPECIDMASLFFHLLQMVDICHIFHPYNKESEPYDKAEQ